jgi:uncharacterized RDD family membrane protein YckC
MALPQPKGRNEMPSAALLVRRSAAYGTDLALLLAILMPITVLLQPMLRIDLQSGYSMWRAVIVFYSIPTWTYFILGDHSLAGATVGKRLLGIRVHEQLRSKVTLRQAIARTAVKLLPLELTHLIFLFADPTAADQRAQTFVLVLANLLALIYLVVTALTHGQRSVHDLVAGTAVSFANR